MKNADEKNNGKLFWQKPEVEIITVGKYTASGLYGNIEEATYSYS